MDAATDGLHGSRHRSSEYRGRGIHGRFGRWIGARRLDGTARSAASDPYGYVALEVIVVFVALVFPLEIKALTPLLAWAYRDGTADLLFPTVRLLSCFVLASLPAIALGATFPFAVRWFEGGAGELYAANTVGAAIGVLRSGFVFLPRIGISGTTLVGVLASSRELSAQKMSLDYPLCASQAAFSIVT